MLKLTKTLRRFFSKEYDIYNKQQSRYLNEETINQQKIPFSLSEKTYEEEWDETLEYNEVEARIYKHLRFFDVDLHKFKMTDHFEGMFDDFETINLLTSLEGEFRIVLPDYIFDNMRSCQDFAEYIIKDGKAFQFNFILIMLKQLAHRFAKRINEHISKDEILAQNFLKQKNHFFKSGLKDEKLEDVDQQQLQRRLNELLSHKKVGYSECIDTLQKSISLKLTDGYELFRKCQLDGELNDQIVQSLLSLEINERNLENINKLLNYQSIDQVQGKEITKKVIDFLIKQKCNHPHKSIDKLVDGYPFDKFIEDKNLKELIEVILKSQIQYIDQTRIYLNEAGLLKLNDNLYFKEILNGERKNLIFDLNVKDYTELFWIDFTVYSSLKKNKFQNFQLMSKMAFEYKDLDYFIEQENTVNKIKNHHIIGKFYYYYVMSMYDYSKDEQFLDKVKIYLDKCSPSEQKLIKHFVQIDKGKHNEKEVLKDIYQNEMRKKLISKIAIYCQFKNKLDTSFGTKMKWIQQWVNQLQYELLKKFTFDAELDESVVYDEMVQLLRINYFQFYFSQGTSNNQIAYEKFLNKKFSEIQRGKSVYTFKDYDNITDARYNWDSMKLTRFLKETNNVEDISSEKLEEILEDLEIYPIQERTNRMSKQKNLDRNLNNFRSSSKNGDYESLILKRNDFYPKIFDKLILPVILNRHQEIKYDEYLSNERLSQKMRDMVKLIDHFDSKNGIEFLKKFNQVFKENEIKEFLRQK